MKKFGGVEFLLHMLLNWALNAGELSAHIPVTFTSREKASSVGLVGD
jgi:hypothetical protein